MTKRRKYRPRKLYTHEELQRLAAPDKSGKQRVYLSKELEGFGVLVSGCSTTKSYIVQRIVDGRTIRLTIGQTRIFDNIEEAVGKGKQLLHRIYDFASGAGKDPRQKQPDKPDPVHKTLRTALADYTAGDELRQTSKDLYQYVVNKYLADWLDLPLADITADQARLRANLKEMPPTAAAYKRYIDKFDQQETEIEQLRGQIKSLQNKELAQRRAIDGYLASLTIE